MLSNQEYIKQSLESNLFFLRIAKEHMIFAAASLPPRDLPVSYQAVAFKDNFERLLARTAVLSKGVVSREVLQSQEIVTDLTLQAEKETEFLTAILIDKSITRKELALKPIDNPVPRPLLLESVSILNHEIIAGLEAAVLFMERLLNNILNCRAFSYIYPTMLDHVIRESYFYANLLKRLEKREEVNIAEETVRQEINWNRIMGEHAKFIRGYLDPSETELFETAHSLSEQFDELLSRTLMLKEQPQLLDEVTSESIDNVKCLRDFKREAGEGIISCRIKSVIIPLLSDHVLREANHYLRLLRTYAGISQTSTDILQNA